MAQYMESFAPNAQEKDVVNAVHKVEDRFVFEHDLSTPAADGRQEALRHIWKGTENFANNNPEAINSLVTDLERQDLLPQLAIAALDEAMGEKTAGFSSASPLTREDALALIDRKDALGDALRKHLDHSYSISPRAGMMRSTGDYGGGYADINTVAPENGQMAYVPAISSHHLDDLTRNFSHPPGYLSTEMQAEEDQKASRWLPILSWLTK